jgi:O-6-methylguanine DNA methyltransferase
MKRSVYKVVSLIPQGQVSTYGDIAKLIGNQKAHRAVAGILKRNEYPMFDKDGLKTSHENPVPCHRVVKSNGEIGGFFGKNFNLKADLLTKEGVVVKNSKVDLSKYRFSKSLMEEVLNKVPSDSIHLKKCDYQKDTTNLNKNLAQKVTVASDATTAMSTLAMTIMILDC